MFSCWELFHSILHVFVCVLIIVIDHSTLLLFNKSNMPRATLFFPFTLLVMLLEGGIALKNQFLSWGLVNGCLTLKANPNSKTDPESSSLSFAFLRGVAAWSNLVAVRQTLSVVPQSGRAGVWASFDQDTWK